MLQTTTSLHSNINIYTGEIAQGNNTLGISAKSVDQSSEKEVRRISKRRQRYQLQQTARCLLPGERVANCMHACGAAGVAVNVSASRGTASFGGVQTCGSVWLCPVCSAKISNARREELNTLLSWARREALDVRMITLTGRHGLEDSLGDLLRAMKGAKKRFHQSKGWRAVDPLIKGHVTATEVTHGRAGWHVHFHMIVILEGGSPSLDLDEVWLRALESEGLSGNGHAYGVQSADQAEEYVTKWGAGEEVTLSHTKEGKAKGRTPWQLLDQAGQDFEADPSASEYSPAQRLFLEYASEFKGKRQLVWSRGLKTLVAIIERTDAELADEPEAEDLVTVAIVPKRVWRLVCRRRLQAELLEVAEQGGAAYVDAWCQALILQTERGVSSGKQS